MTDTIDERFWQGRRVFLTGHTGFKGSWLTAWLLAMEARVHGYALPPAYDRSAYALSGIGETISETIGDINHTEQLQTAMVAADPEIVFHLAAQPLVRESYREPMKTFKTNILGTLNLLENLAKCPALIAAVVVTTDKCYRNQELEQGYSEDDPLGGHDPYSASKACTEIVTQSWYQSYLADKLGLATARAGNVIGGGDWSDDRLVPDLLRAIEQGRELDVRNPHAIRPWQYVLDPLAGYLLLAQHLCLRPAEFSGPWNFGPDRKDITTVGELVEKLLGRLAPDAHWHTAADPSLHETSRLFLNCNKARAQLGWHARYNLDHSLDRIAAWHQAEQAKEDIGEFMHKEISSFMNYSVGGRT